jgi:flagellar FliJ protein
MTRSERIRPIKQLADDRERDAGRVVSRAQAALGAAEKQLADLIGYRADYVVRQHESGAVDAARLQNFQAFLGRLEEAIRQQQAVVEDARRAADACAAEWRDRRIESAQLGKAVVRLRAEELRLGEKRDQNATDERAAQSARPKPD